MNTSPPPTIDEYSEGYQAAVAAIESLTWKALGLKTENDQLRARVADLEEQILRALGEKPR